MFKGDIQKIKLGVDNSQFWLNSRIESCPFETIYGISQLISINLELRFGRIIVWLGDNLGWVDFSRVNLGQKVMNT
jgi:hypothetical protein